MKLASATQPAAARDMPISLVHIGYRRTASSFLQTELFPLIPASGLTTDPDVAVRDAANPALRLAILTNEGLATDMERDQPEMAAELARRFPGARVLIGIRTQYTIMRGYYHLYIKSGGCETYEAFVRARCGALFDFARTVDAYRAAFGAANVSVLLHEDLSANPTATMEALLTFVGQASEIAERVRNHRVKPSVGEAALHVLRLRNIGLAPLERIAPRLYARLLWFGLPGAGMIERALAGRLRLPMDRVRPMIREAYADSNARLFRSIGKDITVYDYPQPGGR